ncbi:MAG: hypothetical protein J1D87_01800 [Lachnospiraceae bacterium]|nr:hypothetical protein [Lachnospiraceae bacterium]
MEDGILLVTVAALFVIVIALIAFMLYFRIYRMARIYNWNGKRYCYLGNAALRREGKDFAIRLGERMVDLSHTTLYRICPSRAFCMKNRYRDMFVYADGDRRHVVVDLEPMKTEIPY